MTIHGMIGVFITLCWLCYGTGGRILADDMSLNIIAVGIVSMCQVAAQ